jgi:peptidoglycan hydrolase CwlO-like protein
MSKYIFLSVFSLSLLFCSCGGKSNKKNVPIVDTTTIDTANIDQLEKELKDLEEKSSKVNNKLDSIDNVLNEK